MTKGEIMRSVCDSGCVASRDGVIGFVRRSALYLSAQTNTEGRVFTDLWRAVNARKQLIAVACQLVNIKTTPDSCLHNLADCANITHAWFFDVQTNKDKCSDTNSGVRLVCFSFLFTVVVTLAACLYGWIYYLVHWWSHHHFATPDCFQPVLVNLPFQHVFVSRLFVF